MTSGGLQSDQSIDNLFEQIKDLQERLEQLERHALTSQDIQASKVALGTIQLSEVFAGAVHASEGVYSGPRSSGYAAMGVMPENSVGDFIFFRDGLIAGILRGDSVDDLVWQRYNPKGTFVDTRLRLDSSTGDIYSVPWTYYDPSPTAIGWTSLTTKIVYYKKVGNTVFVNFALQGTSNLATAYIFLPWNVGVASGASFQVCVCGVDNGSPQTLPARLDIPASGNQFNMYKTLAAGGWTPTGVKGVRGQFHYQALNEAT
jgi:hypothetical protein